MCPPKGKPPFPHRGQPTMAIGFLLGKAAQVARAGLEQRLGELGLRLRHFMLLSALDRMPDELTQQQVGERLMLDRTTMVAAVDDLEQLGFVERVRNPRDRRAFLLRLTPDGQKAVRRAYVLAREAHEHLLEDLSEDERTQLVSLLGRLLACHMPPWAAHRD